MKTELDIRRKGSSFQFPARRMTSRMIRDDDDIMHSETALIETLAISLAFAFVVVFLRPGCAYRRWWVTC